MIGIPTSLSIRLLAGGQSGMAQTQSREKNSIMHVQSKFASKIVIFCIENNRNLTICYKSK
jgi:hypothetical protein